MNGGHGHDFMSHNGIHEHAFDLSVQVMLMVTILYTIMGVRVMVFCYI